MMVVRFGGTAGTAGMTEASMTQRLSTPCTRPCWLTTAPSITRAAHRGRSQRMAERIDVRANIRRESLVRGQDGFVEPGDVAHDRRHLRRVRQVMHEADAVLHPAQVHGIGTKTQLDGRLLVRIGAAQREPPGRPRAHQDRAEFHRHWPANCRADLGNSRHIHAAGEKQEYFPPVRGPLVQIPRGNLHARRVQTRPIPAVAPEASRRPDDPTAGPRHREGPRPVRCPALPDGRLDQCRNAAGSPATRWHQPRESHDLPRQFPGRDRWPGPHRPPGPLRGGPYRPGSPGEW